MAQKIKLDKKTFLQPLVKIKPWVSNKTTEVRKLAEHPAARAARRWGAPAGVAFVALLVIGSLFFPDSRFQQMKNRLQRNPHDFQAQIEMAEIFLDNHQFEEAERMLLLAQNQKISSNQQVLGEQTELKLEELWQKKIAADPQEIKELINGWETIVEAKPDYRDAYLQLAHLHYLLFQEEETLKNLQKATDLDPNYPLLEKMRAVITP
jgi:tetratricopeptide (TPR) repeat protein